MRYARLLPVLAMACISLGALPEDAAQLRNLGLAQLENEHPAEAEATFRELAERLPDDPLPLGNLAIALLRQQESREALEAIDAALALSPGRPDLLAIKGDILQWSGEREAALDLYRQAAAGAPRDPQLQYALLRLAATLSGPSATAARDAALKTLADLRPENVVVLLQLGQRAIERRDRATASRAFLRLRELLWQAQPLAGTALQMALDALEESDVGKARVPALRLENVLKITPMYQQGLRELQMGIQGIPILRFEQEPPPRDFGEPVPVRFTTQALATAPTAGHALSVGDFDGDGGRDFAWIGDGKLEVHLATGAVRELEAPSGLLALATVDLDNDGALDLLAWGPKVLQLWRGDGSGGFSDGTRAAGLSTAGARAAVAFDFDIEGDLDLFVAGGASGLELWRNSLSDPLETVGRFSLPRLALDEVAAAVASDLDRDGDPDLVLAHAAGLTLLENLRQGELADRSREAGLNGQPALRAVVSADLDSDGWPDLIGAGRGLTLLHNREGRFEPWAWAETLRTTARFDTVLSFDADNDGRLDLAVGGEAGVVILLQAPAGGFRFLVPEAGPRPVRGLAAADLDADGDLDLLAVGPAGLYRLTNEGGNANHWLDVGLRGLAKGNSKNNLWGLGSTLEILNGSAYQFREVTGDVTHFGLGAHRQAEILRVVWSNGVPQNRLEAGTDQLIVEEQLLKGSCPFLYAWNGKEIGFVTDLLWGAPLGLPAGNGAYVSSDPSELVRVDGARPRDGIYDLRITEELWEAAFFDLTRAWIVDHPADVEVASALKILPGEATPEMVLGTRRLRPLSRAVDAAGRDVTERLSARDEVYADGWTPGPYQGLAATPWNLVLDLGVAPGGAVRLLLDGWIFPSDASLNVAVAQRSDLAPMPPRLEVETSSGWRVLVPSMGFPAGKTKTMVVDTPPLPQGAHRLRIVSNLWLSWDRIVWSQAPADGAPVIRARLAPERAELRFRGFSTPIRLAPNAPHSFDYATLRLSSPWLPFPGRYTRYGDVRELLVAVDDRAVILASGDELALRFDARSLPPPPPGWRRTLFLESHGWDKDADRNTGAGERVDPLPFAGMRSYPYAPGERYPEDERHKTYRERWLTRQVGRGGTLP